MPPGRLAAPDSAELCAKGDDRVMGLSTAAHGVSMIPTPRLDASVVAVPPPGEDPGHWAGSPSACLDGDDILLAYRLRRPVGRGRGYAVVVDRWAGGALAGPGTAPELSTEVVLDREDFACDSLERPALRRGPAGDWYLWISANTPDSAHWRLDLLRAGRPADLGPGSARTVLTGVASGAGPTLTAVKDCVCLWHAGQWWMWVCVHPLEDPTATDRHWTDLLTSPDGYDWTWVGTVLAPRPGHWDARGARAAAVVLGGDERVLVAYDGRARAEQNYAEQTGFATGPIGGPLTSVDDDGPAARSPYGDGALRYLEVLALPDGSSRLFFEAARPDGAHELRTQVVPTS
jgi:hypothetical protein